MTNTEKPVEAAETPTPAAQPQAPATQYIVSERSLNGIGGWLVFWMIVFAIGGLGFLAAFFAAIESGVGEATTVLALIFTPIMSIGYIASTILIAMQKRLARYVALGSIAVGTLYSLISAIVGFAQSRVDTSVAALILTLLMILIVNGLVGLYFVLSKRVNQTLVK